MRNFIKNNLKVTVMTSSFSCMTFPPHRHVAFVINSGGYLNGYRCFILNSPLTHTFLAWFVNYSAFTIATGTGSNIYKLSENRSGDRFNFSGSMALRTLFCGCRSEERRVG